MSYCGNKLLKQGLQILPMVALLSGCGLEVKDDNGTVSAQAQSVNEPSVQLAGTAVKGVIQQGIVTAHRVLADETGLYAVDRVASESVRTADDGRYKLRLPGKAEGWAIVEIRADEATRMVCDVFPQCDQGAAGMVAFGGALNLPSDFILRGAGDLAAKTVYLTPLTHLAVSLAERNAVGGLSPTSLAGAYQAVEGWFGLAAGALRLAPPDLTRLDELNDVSADGLQMAITNAAFLALVNENPQWQSIADVLNDMTAQVAANGQIDILGNGVNLALSDIVAAATLQASELQMAADSSIISQKLVIVEYRSMQRFKTIADVYEAPDTSLADTDNDATDGDVTSDGDNGTPTDAIADNSDDQVVDSPETNAGGNSDDSAGGNTGGDTAGSTNELPTNDTGSEVGVSANAALLSWTAPMTRVNGESLSMGEIAGFEVVYGVAPDALAQTLAVGDASVEELLVDQLDAGTWYFAIRTLDTDGNRSQLSEVVNKQI